MDSQKRNTPVEILIQNYIDKKSGKVSESKKELMKRFKYLDWDDQKTIALAFLSSSKTDRNWMYPKLLNLWEPQK